jgi:hypothetical protein
VDFSTAPNPQSLGDAGGALKILLHRERTVAKAHGLVTAQLTDHLHTPKGDRGRLYKLRRAIQGIGQHRLDGDVRMVLSKLGQEP